MEDNKLNEDFGFILYFLFPSVTSRGKVASTFQASLHTNQSKCLRSVELEHKCIKKMTSVAADGESRGQESEQLLRIRVQTVHTVKLFYKLNCGSFDVGTKFTSIIKILTGTAKRIVFKVQEYALYYSE